MEEPAGKLGAESGTGVILGFCEGRVISGGETRPENGGLGRADRRTFFGKFLVGTGIFGNSQVRPTRVIYRGAVIRINTFRIENEQRIP